MEISEAVRKAAIEAADRTYLDNMIEDEAAFDKAIIAAVEAALTAREAEAGAVKVKQLDWVDTYGGMQYEAETPFGRYTLWTDSGMWWAPGEKNPQADDDPKTAAQADFDSRIRSCIASPAPHVAEEWRTMETAPKQEVGCFSSACLIGSVEWGKEGRVHRHVGPIVWMGEPHGWEFTEIGFDSFPPPTRWRPWPAYAPNTKEGEDNG